MVEDKRIELLIEELQCNKSKKTECNAIFSNNFRALSRDN